MFDSHAHYDDKQFDEDRDILISSLFEQGVKGFLNASSDIASSRASLALAHKYENVYAAVGIHPHEAAEVSEDWLNELDKISSDKKAVAIGEIGLDYHYDFSPRDIQMKVFEAQMAFAEKKNMPVVIHDREAHGDTLAVIDKFPNVKGVLHSFSGSYEMAEYLVRKGWYISFSGSVTFKTAEKLRHAVTAVPIERVMCETDAPYLTPVPYRGRRNSPEYIPNIAEKFSEYLGMPVDELGRITTENGKRFFEIED